MQLQCYEDAKLWCEKGLAVSFAISCFLCARPTVIKKEHSRVTCRDSILGISLPHCFEIRNVFKSQKRKEGFQPTPCPLCSRGGVENLGTT